MAAFKTDYQGVHQDTETAYFTGLSIMSSKVTIAAA